MLIARIIRAMRFSTPHSPCGNNPTPPTTAPAAQRASQPLRHLSASRPRPWRQAVPGTPQQADRLLTGWMLGQPTGEPWLVLHGGPGSVAQGGLLAPFHANQHWAWGLQQRGSGPLGVGRHSARWHVDALLADMEALRQQLGLAQWSVLGGSWGALVALAYVQKYPQSVSRVVLRGPFLGRSADVWCLLDTVRQLHPMRVSPHTTALPGGLLPLPHHRLLMPSWLAQAQRVLRNATVAPQHHPLVRAWLLAETRMATRGAWRAVLHRATPGTPGIDAPSPASLRRTWGQMQRQTRLRSAQLRTGHRPTLAHGQKMGLQVRVLSRQCCRALHGGWPLWRRWLLGQAGEQHPVGTVAEPCISQPDCATTPRLTLLQGRFDAVCAPANALHLHGLGCVEGRAKTQPLAQTQATAVSLHWIHGGHLASEPAMHQALTHAVAHTVAEVMGRP